MPVDPLRRNHVTSGGNLAGSPMMFAHGFGCDQHMWRYVTPAFEDEYRTVLFDHVGFGHSSLEAWDPARYGTLQAYADDAIDICRALELRDVTFVGHSVAAMIGVRAALTAPEIIGRLVMVCPSPRYIDTDDYVGGFSEEAIGGLLDSLDRNYLGWSASMAPVIVGSPDRPALGQELTNSFCRTDPDVAKLFARVTFLSDSRSDLPLVKQPALVIQTRNDPIAPEAVGRYVAKHMPDAQFSMIDATGHCPNLSAPDQTVAATQRFLRGG